jgi:hypothetical protein
MSSLAAGLKQAHRSFVGWHRNTICVQNLEVQSQPDHRNRLLGIANLHAIDLHVGLYWLVITSPTQLVGITSKIQDLECPGTGSCARSQGDAFKHDAVGARKTTETYR